MTKRRPDALALIVRAETTEYDKRPMIVGKAILQVSAHVNARICDALSHIAEVQCLPCVRLTDVTGRFVYVDTQQLEG